VETPVPTGCITDGTSSGFVRGMKVRGRNHQVSRRDFLKVGASALAAPMLAGCNSAALPRRLQRGPLKPLDRSLAGRLQPAEPLVGKPPIYISHSSSDSILPVRTTRESLVPDLSNANYDVTYEEFDGDHEVPAGISESALDWFLGVSPAP